MAKLQLRPETVHCTGAAQQPRGALALWFATRLVAYGTQGEVVGRHMTALAAAYLPLLDCLSAMAEEPLPGSLPFLELVWYTKHQFGAAFGSHSDHFNLHGLPFVTMHSYSIGSRVRVWDTDCSVLSLVPNLPNSKAAIFIELWLTSSSGCCCYCAT